MKTALQIKSAAVLARFGGINAFLRCGVIFFAAVLAVNARLIGGVTGFGAAFAAALPKKEAFAALAGSFLGYSLFGNSADRLVLFPALFLLFAVKLLFPQFASKKLKPVFAAAVSFGILLGCGIGAAIVEEAGTVSLILRVLQAACCFGATYFCAAAYRVFSSRKEFERYTGFEYLSVGVVAAVFLVALCDFRLFSFSLGRIAGLLTVLVFVGREGLSCAFVSAGVTVAFSLYSADFAPYGGAMMAAAIAANTLRPVGKLGQIAAFSAVNTCLSFFGGVGSGAFAYLLDSFLAASVVSVLPGETLRWKAEEDEKENGIQFRKGDWLSGKLRFASLALQDLRSSVDLVSGRIRKNEFPEVTSVFVKSADAVCSHCGLKVFCWETQRDETFSALQTTLPLLKREGKLREEEMPQYFKTKCCKCTALTAAVNRYYQSYLSHCQSVRMSEEAKQISFEQLDGVADLLKELGDEVGEIGRVEEGRIDAVHRLFKEQGLFPEQLVCYTGKEGRAGVEAYLKEEPKGSLMLLCERLSELLEVELELPVVTRFGEQIRLAFFESAQYRVESYVGQLAAAGEKLCGDRCESFSGPDGFFYFVLSDGMGSGNHAALDASMVCSFIIKLLGVGFGFSSALKFVNASLFVKESEESFATIDLFRADLYTGRLELFKAGAAPTFLRKGSSVRRLESDSLPVGILRGTGFDCRCAALSEGDLVLMVSDGVTATGIDWVEAELERCGEKSVKEVVERILSEARRRRIDGHNDDITAAAFRLKRAD